MCRGWDLEITFNIHPKTNSRVRAAVHIKFKSFPNVPHEKNFYWEKTQFPSDIIKNSVWTVFLFSFGVEGSVMKKHFPAPFFTHSGRQLSTPADIKLISFVWKCCVRNVIAPTRYEFSGNCPAVFSHELTRTFYQRGAINWLGHLHSQIPPGLLATSPLTVFYHSDNLISLI